MRNGILLSAALLTAALSGSLVYAQTAGTATTTAAAGGSSRGTPTTSPTVGLKAMQRFATGAAARGTVNGQALAAPRVNTVSPLTKLILRSQLRNSALGLATPTPTFGAGNFISPALGLITNPNQGFAARDSFRMGNQGVGIIGPNGELLIPSSAPRQGARTFSVQRPVPIGHGGQPVKSKILGSRAGARTFAVQGRPMLTTPMLTSPSATGQSALTNAAVSNQATGAGVDQFGNPTGGGAAQFLNTGVGAGVTDNFGNPIGNAFDFGTNGVTPVSGNLANQSFFPGFVPGLATLPFGFGSNIIYPPPSYLGAPPPPPLPSMASAVPTLGVTAPGSLRNPLRSRALQANRGRRVRIVDGTVGSGRVIDGGDGTNLNYRTLMAQQSEVAPAPTNATTPGAFFGGGGAVALNRPRRSTERMARSRQDINERVARAQAEEIFIEGVRPLTPGTRSGAAIARTGSGAHRNNNGVVERVAGSRQEIYNGVSDVLIAPADTEQVRLVKRAESIMRNRPLVQGRVVRAGATGIEVNYDVNGVYRTEVFSPGQVFFFRGSGEMAAADTDPAMVSIGSSVLVPMPGSEPRRAVLGSRQESRTHNTYNNYYTNSSSGRTRTSGGAVYGPINRHGRSFTHRTAVRSRVAGSRQTVRRRRPAK